jgi:hypothetical protein
MMMLMTIMTTGIGDDGNVLMVMLMVLMMMMMTMMMLMLQETTGGSERLRRPQQMHHEAPSGPQSLHPARANLFSLPPRGLGYLLPLGVPLLLLLLSVYRLLPGLNLNMCTPLVNQGCRRIFAKFSRLHFLAHVAERPPTNNQAS